jgi:hypothetical protein
VKLLSGPGTRPAFWLLVETRIAADTRPGGLRIADCLVARKDGEKKSTDISSCCVVLQPNCRTRDWVARPL